jgi:hypothetical protein
MMLVVETRLFIILFVPCIAISICKEGYSFGRPSASITLLHELPVRCEDLERLVINQIVLPESYKDQQSLIEEVCACRPSMDQRILILEDEILNDGGNSLPQDIQQQVTNPKDTIRSPNSAIIAPSVSPLSRNINYSPSSIRVPLESSPSPSWNTPTLYPSNMINDPTISDNSSADNFLPYVCTGIAVLLVCTCIISAFNILDAVPNNSVISSILSGTAAPRNPDVSNESEEETLKARRRIVIESLFLSQDTQVSYLCHLSFKYICFPWQNLIFHFHIVNNVYSWRKEMPRISILLIDI